MSTEAPSILVVDDDVDTCHNLADILVDLGYQVEVANDGVTALERLRARPFRIALLDYRMPGMDGLTLCRAIRDQRADTISIIVTAYAGGISPDEFLAAGASLVLPKPVDVARLLGTLEKTLGETTKQT